MNICKRCGYAVTHRQHVAQCVQGVTPPVTSVTKPVAQPVVVTRTVTPLDDDRHACPVCGDVHGRARTDAERSRAYRERRRAT